MRRALGVLGASVAATAVMTWPVARHLADHLVVPRIFIGRGLLPTSPDTYLHLWILAWIQHALATDPKQLFDATIMYPARNALAGSEHMLAHWPLHAPVYAATGNPVLAYQWVLVSAFVLNATVTFALVRRWTGSAPAGALAAFVYAFCPLRFDLIGTVQHLNVAYLPLIVFFADRHRSDGRVRDLVGVAVATALQALCSYYLAYATAVAVAVVCLVVTFASPRRALAIGMAAAVGFVPLALVSAPYLALRSAAVVPVYPEVWLRAASATPSWLIERGRPLFAGWLPIALAVVGALLGRGQRWQRGLAAALLATGFVLVLGPVTTVCGRAVVLPYRLLYDWVPGFASLRYPYRFGVLSALGVALLAGFGWARVAAGRALAWPLTAAALVVLAAEYWQAPLELVPVEVGNAVPPVYGWLDEHGAGRPVLEWPVAPPGDLRAGYDNARAMYFGTYHWLPLLNGYTAYEPPSFGIVSLLAQRLPDARSLRDLIDLTGVRLLLVHRDRLAPWNRERWMAWLDAGCERVAEFGADVVCALPPPREELTARLIAANEDVPAETFRGLALAPLPPRALRGRMTVEPGAVTLVPGLIQRLRVVVTNDGERPWPGLAPLAPGVMAIRHRWRPVGGMATDPGTASPLLCDLAPGESCAVVLPVTAPRDAGAWTLELGLGQEGGADVALDGGTVLAVPVEVAPLGPRRAAP
jgi:hypothetical protein